MSCGAACARQLLRDAGIECDEATIRNAAQFDPNLGIYTADLAAALSQLDPRRHYHGGSIDPDELGRLLERAPFIAMLDDHFVIVDRELNGVVFIRDPAGEGSGWECEMDSGEFGQRWTRGVHQAVFKI